MKLPKFLAMIQEFHRGGYADGPPRVAMIVSAKKSYVDLGPAELKFTGSQRFKRHAFPVFAFCSYAKLRIFHYFSPSSPPVIKLIFFLSYARELLSFSRASLISFLFLLRVSLRFNHRSSIIYFCASSIFSFESCDDFSQYFVSLVFFKS